MPLERWSIKNLIKNILLFYRLGLRRCNVKNVILFLKFTYKTVLLKKNIPSAVILGLTYQCQCRCPHCSVSYSNFNKKERMSNQQLKLLMNKIAKLSIPKINFFGGEPLLLNSDLIELVEYGFKKGLSISIDTNGILLTEDFIKALKKAGVNNINISLDSSECDLHDKLRVFPGAFDKVITALRLCVKEGIPCLISTYASKRTIHSGDLANIIELGRKLHVTAVKILLPLHSGRWLDNRDEFLSQEEKNIVFNLLEPGFVYLESPLYSLKKGKKVCEALDKKIIFISPYGDIQICYTVPFSFGNVQEKKLEDLISGMWDSIFFNSINNNYDCIMNNPHFRNRFYPAIKKSEHFPIKYAGAIE